MSKWYKSPLEKVADIRLSNVDKKIIDGEVPVRLCNYMDAYSNYYLDARINYSQGSVKLAEIDRFGLLQGDVVITKDSETPDDIAVPAVVVDQLEKVICGYHLAILRPKKDILDGVFLMNALREHSTKQWFVRKANGITRYGLSKSSIENVEVNYPELYHQRKIARILVTIDKVIKQTETTIEKLKKIKQGMMHDLFTRGIDVKTGKLRPPQSEAPELYKKTELGWIPKEWDVVAVKDYGSVVTGNTPSKNIISNWGNDFLWASPFDFYEKYIYETQTLLSNDGKKCARIVPAGAVLITCIASLGKNAIAEFEMAFNQQINAVIVNRDNDNEYFYYNILHDGIRFSALAGQTAVPIINKTTFEKFKLTKALFPEQKIIANRISKADEYLLKTKNELIKYEKLKYGLMQDLLTGKVEVVPDPQDKEYQGVN